ncbi:hypothetical protein N7510_002660 [Penicillium lagena]|uniref:uncharacterized protein n=1 Tax=Penicillium lagena TaxID=94218 RepID=UPI002540B276|nr:uncharacterized protein N7510_002660 [Penicillium lagena]KAJ5626351.1 hypothetical protein N7510_002660 [Penicillium lagena]
MLISSRALCHALLAGFAIANLSSAADVRDVDASSPASTPRIGQLEMGSAAAGHAPNGDTLNVTSESLVLNKKPWLPVMGEFHYSRYPADQWLPELRKMKGAGVNIVSTYVIWIHHEEIQGQIDWSGSCNITRFVEAAAEVGIFVVARVGPYVHSEVRNGGLPDWVIHKSAVIRSNDPIYMSFVTSFWTELAEQIKGLVFKNGGPIIGVQLENEYSLNGSGQGAAHITTLKSLTISLGLDVPLYTCTGWQGAHYPPYQVVPVFGGYQDLPWDTLLADEPPSETYSFRYFSKCVCNNLSNCFRIYSKEMHSGNGGNEGHISYAKPM